jgi:hypothetical protein
LARFGSDLGTGHGGGVTLRTAILWCSLVCAVAPAARAQSEPPGRVLPLPPIAPIPAANPSDRRTDPPPRPNLSTSFQLPKDGRSPFEGPGPVLPERPRDPIPAPPTVDMPVGSRVTLPSGGQQVIRFGPRYGQLNTAKSEPVPNDDDPTKKDTQRVTYLGGLVINVEYMDGTSPRKVELAADNVVMWVKNVKTELSLSDPLRVDTPRPQPDAEGQEGGDKKVRVNMYLSGNVVIRTKVGDTTFGGPTEQVFRAAEVFYDVDNSRAVAVKADLELKFARAFDSIHLRAAEIDQLGRHDVRALDATVFSSKRPADPTLTFDSRYVTLTEEVKERRNIFGRVFRDARTGQPDVSTERLMVTQDTTTRILGVPVGYARQATIDLDDPLGPLRALTFRSDRVFGQFQVYSTFDVYDLLGVRGPEGNNWVVHADYLSLRGPGLGTDYQYRDLFGPAYRNVGAISAYGLYDDADGDILGGFRGLQPRKPYLRSRFQWVHNQDLFEVGTAFTRLQAQFAYLSDNNFYEQFWKLRFDQDPNPETFLYLYGGVGNFAWSGLGQVNVNRPWVTETQWLPRLDAALIGESFFDTLVSTTRVSGGYALFRPATQGAVSDVPGEQQAVDTLRGDVYQRLSLPFDLGPVRLEPFGVGSVTGYSKDATGESNGRLYGGGGVKASIPFSKLYPEVRSDLLNLRGIHHKVELRGEYFIAESNTDHTQLPVLDRLNDDVSDLSYRSFRRFGGRFELNGGVFNDTPALNALATSPAFDPQRLANRRLVQSRPEALDDMHAVRTELHQRWQTKRGPSGNDHTVDVMSLDIGATYFPNRTRDNFGQSFGLLDYNWVWNVGDRTAVTSSGWYDPFAFGTRYFNIGVYYNRPDGSNFYLGYRHTDPIGSRVFLAVIGYQFTKKYSISVLNVLDVSNSFVQGTTVAFNRTGTDMTMSLGLSYNSFQNNFGVQFLIVPNAALYNRGGVGNLFLQ